MATGPDHVLVLTSRDDVWAWGNNCEGILGFGHNKPIQRPNIIPNLSGVNIKQVKFIVILVYSSFIPNGLL